jgi:AbrB family looped-hinge helix DNA binding protein
MASRLWGALCLCPLVFVCFLLFYTGIIPSIIIDKAGRIVIPKEIRDKLRLGAGDSLSLQCDGESLTMRPVQAGAPLRKEHGIWVFHSSKPLSLEEANQIVRDVREQRDRQNAGERRR